MDIKIDQELDFISERINDLYQQFNDFQGGVEKNQVLIDYLSHQAHILNVDLNVSNAQMKIIMDRFR